MRPLSLFPWLMPRTPLPTMLEIGCDVASQHGLSLDDLRARTRVRDVVRPRQEAMSMMLATGRYRLSDIGRFFRVHRTTVRHAIDVHRSAA